MPEARTIATPRQLLVEGKDAEVFFQVLVDRLALETIQIQDFGGVDQFRTFIKGFRVTTGFKDVQSIGIVRDAERDPDQAFRRIGDALTASGLISPATPQTRSAGHPSVTVFILPGGGGPGMLESLCLRTVAENPVMPCVDDFFRCVEARTREAPRNVDKARAHAFLATRERPLVHVGLAAKRGYWNFDTPVLDPLKSWLRGL